MEDSEAKTKDVPTPTPELILPAPPEKKFVIHTYKADLALAMDTTDATVVQELLENAREQELTQKEAVVIQHQRGWYTTGGIILLILALGAVGYSIYYYKNLTVQVVSSPTVGVFRTTQPLIADSTDIVQGITKLVLDTTLPAGKPILVPIVSDSTTRTPLDTKQSLLFMNIRPSEPFLATLSLVRLGIMNTGSTVSPFLIFSTPHPESASKEFLIAEPALLNMVAPVLNIDLSDKTKEVRPTFMSTYMYNLPVRTLRSVDIDTKEETILLYYGYATDNTIIVATNPTILKAIYDAIIRQQ